MAAQSAQPTPFRIFLQDLRFAQPEVVIFASSNLQHKVWCVSTTSISGGPAPPARQGWADWQAYPLYGWSPLPSGL